MAGLIKLDKDFLHKEVYLTVKDNPPCERLVAFEVDVTGDADATSGEPIFLPDGTPVGRVTSGAYGASVGKSLALGSIKGGIAKSGDRLDIFILGKAHKAWLLAEPAFDPAGEKLRA